MAAGNYPQVLNCSFVYEDPKIWSFFEPPNGSAYWLDKLKTMAMRTAEDRTHQCGFFYIGRMLPPSKLNSQPKHSVVKFSVYEGSKILHWLEPIMDMIEQYEDRRPRELIPYFGEGAEAEAKAEQTIDPKDRCKFWTNDVDLQLATVKVKICFDTVSGKYVLHLLNPVKPELVEKHSGWPGPSCMLRQDSLAPFRRFIKREIGGFDETDGGGDGNKSG